jgi:glucose/arabinose dehydrogenase
MKNKIFITASRRGRLAVLVFLLFFTASATKMYAQLPTGFIAKKLTNNDIKECVKMAHAPDGRIFLAERAGKVKVLQNGTTTTIHTVTTTDASEQGLLGIAVHSDFASNGKLYLYYTDPAITVHYLDMVVLNSASQVVSSTRLMQFDPIVNGFHNGGAMVVKNSYIYLCIGESNAPQYAQQLDTYRGKVLRLLDDGQPAPGNPYYSTTGANRQQKSIWAIGMRNPWSMSMDPITQKLFVCNVGGNYEEINDVTSPDPAKNYDYGWGAAGKSGPEQVAGTIFPVFTYNRSTWTAQTCAITSGTFFNPPSTNYPAQYKNKFYFTDWCTDWLRSIDSDNPSAGYQEFFPTGFGRILGTSTGIDGNIYYSEYGNTGNIWRLEYTLSQLPVIANDPSSQTVYATEPVSFSVSASGSNPLSYQWQKNSVNISGATSSTYTINATATADAGSYRVIVTNSVGSDTSTAATLTVLPFNAKPVPHILTPTSTTTCNMLDVISYSGSATDQEDGTLPASAYNWEVRLFHKDCATCEHWHPGPAAADGVKSGTFIADNGGETSSNIWLRVILTVTDANGRTAQDSVDIQPNKVQVTVNCSKPGLQVIIGTESVTPYTKTMVVNTATTIDAVTPQTIGDTIYVFSSWDHGGPAEQSFRVPTTNVTYKANYTAYFVDNTNIALNKKAYASSLQTAGNSANKAVDGTLNSRWESMFSDPQWIAVNLGATYYINRVKITWENAMAKDYVVQISDDSLTWTPIKSVSGNAVSVNDLTGLAASGKYIRIYGTSRTTVYGYSIFELEVYGALAPTGNTAPTVSITSPANNATFTSPASIVINASAADSDGSVTKVDFYNGAALLGTDATAPYSYTWTGVAAGNYALTAKATDNSNAVTTSATVNVVVNSVAGTNLALNKPTFSLSVENGGTPAKNATDGIANSRWSSAFADPQWLIVNLGAQYDLNHVKITWENAMGKDYLIQVSPDSVTWNTMKTVTANSTLVNDWTGLSGTGKYVKMYGTARATGYGYSIFELEVYGSLASTNVAPTVTITAPANNASYNAPASIAINATAADSDGSVTKVDFYNGATLLGTSTTAPYSYTWTGVAAGTYALTAKATDNSNAVTTSTTVNVTVNASNQLPTVSITSPANNASYNAPASIVINATAADSDGSVTKVDFYNGATLLGTSTTAPYSYTWTGVATGTYALTAKATDNLNAVTTSAPVNVVVNVSNVNLALNKPTFSLSIENGGTLAKYATDGVANTRWSSAFADPQWLIVNLGAQYDINRVKITWEAAKGKDYLVQVSADSMTWNTIKNVTGNSVLVNDWTGLSGTGKYVRIYGTARTTQYGYSIYELEVYGASTARLASDKDMNDGVAFISSSTEGVLVYPNPFTQELTVVALFKTNALVNLIMIDVNGSVVLDKDFENPTGHFENIISVKELPAGTYVLKLISGDEVFTQKLIKQ